MALMTARKSSLTPSAIEEAVDLAAPPPIPNVVTPDFPPAACESSKLRLFEFDQPIKVPPY